MRDYNSATECMHATHCVFCSFLPLSLALSTQVFRREDKVAAAEVREHRTWDRFALNLGINLSHLKASLLDDTAFLVGTPVK